jgi:DNA-binding NarL/FixJ family response regulator
LRAARALTILGVVSTPEEVRGHGPEDPTPTACRCRLDWRCRHAESFEVALESSDPLLRLMAHALDYLTRNVDTFIASYLVLDRRGNTWSIDPCVIKCSSPDAPPFERLYDAYASNVAEDPLTRRASAGQKASIHATAEISAELEYPSSPTGKAFAELGIGPRLRLMLYDDGEPIAAVSLVRRAGRSEFNSREMDFVRASEEFLSVMHVIAARRARTSWTVDRLAGEHGLSPRQSQIMQLVVHGLSNVRIAEQMECSATTVRDELRAVYAALGVRTRVKLSELAQGKPRNESP